jgi:hypothetical protein
MFILKSKEISTGLIQQSDFQTMDELNTHQTQYFSDTTIYENIVSTINPIPDPISPRQIRLALLASGITDAMVIAQINTLSIPDKDAAMIAWQYSGQFDRSVPAVAQIGLMLGYNSDTLDALWKAAILL